MNRKSIIISLLAVFLLPLASLRAQDIMSLYFMETIPQLSRINPAMQPRANVYVALPSTSFTFRSDLGVRDFLQKNGSERVTPVDANFDYNKFNRRMGKSWNIDMGMDVTPIGFGFRTKRNGYFTFNISVKTDMRNDIPAHLFKLTETGIKGSLNLSTLRQKTIAYKQISIGYSRELNDRLTLGANVRPLFGLAAISTDLRKFDINFNKEQWNFALEGDVYVSGPLDVTPTANNDFPKYELRDIDGDVGIDYAKSFSNPGIAVDLGAVYKLTNRLTLSAALNNLGLIFWGNDLHNISGSGSFDFRGVEMNDPDQNWDTYFDDLGKQFETALNYETGTGKSFTTSLTPQVYLGAEYELTQALSVGLLSRSLLLLNGIHQEFNLSANIQPYRRGAFNINVTQNIRGGTYAGFGGTFYLGPLQIYLLSDFPILRVSYVSTNKDGSIPEHGRFFRGSDLENFGLNGGIIPLPERFKGMSFMAGVNLVFGKKGFRNRPMLDR
ncbi:MAG: DUF5723 family protein [Cytophagaceae bacterium]|jgi:hypothetical protein|nr:DUF5723 family protein [Cytophagaceae bacterium]